MKVKVKVAELIAKAEGRRQEIIENHRKAKERYEAERERHQKKVVATLRKALKRAEAGKNPSDKYGRVSLPDGPPKPRLNTNAVDRDLAVLRACATDTLSISTDDNFARYL